MFGDTSHKRLPRFLAIYVLLGVLNLAFLKVVVMLGVGALLAQAVALPLMAACGYAGMRTFVYRPRSIKVARQC